MTHTAPRAFPIGRLLLAGLLALTFVLAFLSVATPAIADDADDTVRWSVVPADENGPDGRRAVETELDPGETLQDRFAVRKRDNAKNWSRSALRRRVDLRQNPPA